MIRCSFRSPSISEITAPKRSIEKTEDTPSEKLTKPSTESHNDLESLLSAATAKEREAKRVNEELMELINTPTVMVCSALHLPMPFIL